MQPVYVLIGGRSERFGRDKATFPLDGEPWALQVGRRLAGDGDLTLVGEVLESESLGDARRIADSPLAAGPVGGVLSAVADRRARLGDGRLVIASCDLVRPTAAWFEPLLAALDADPSASAAAYHAQGHWQPFPMIADTRRLATARTEPSPTSLRGWLEAIGALRVAWPGPGDAPPQANRRSELPG